MLAGVELGGTKCVCILAHGPDDIIEQVVLPTEAGPETLAAIARQLGRWHFEALGIASFGPLDLRNGRISQTPKPGWSGADLTSLAPAGTPLRIDTDVNGAALAEGRWGAAHDLTSWAYITVGTGLGVGSIVAGHPVRGLGHSEAGHMRLPNPRGLPGICPFHGDCAEGLASGPAILARAGRPGAELDADHSVWLEVAEILAALCHNLVLTTAPERILIGGGVAMGQPGLLPRIRDRLVASLAGYAAGAAVASDPESFVAAPGLGAMTGPLGAIALARAALDLIDQPEAPIGKAGEEGTPFI